MTRKKMRRFFAPVDTPIYIEPDERSESRLLGRDDRLSLMQDREVDGVAWRWVYVRPGVFGKHYTYIKASVPILPAKYRIRTERLGMYFLFSLVASPILSNMRIVFPDSLWAALFVFVSLSIISMILSSASNMFGFLEWRRADEARPAFELRRILLGEGVSLTVLLITIAAITQLSRCGR